MPPLKSYRLFISHAWRYGDEYDRLINLLEKAKRFQMIDYSVPRQEPLSTRTDSQLQAALDRQIRPVNAVLVISRMYYNHREWMQCEIDIAEHYAKPIIGIQSWGAKRIPQEVQSVAKEMVGWNTKSIVAAIRKYA